MVKTQYLKELKLIESVFGDTSTIEEMKAAVQEAFKLATRENVFRFLVDCSNLKKGGTIVQLYSLGEFFLQLNIQPGTKQAVILSNSPVIQKDILFYETTIRNRGYDIKVFFDRSEAVAWLLHD